MSESISSVDIVCVKGWSNGMVYDDLFPEVKARLSVCDDAQ
jgi:hypothetical protein